MSMRAAFWTTVLVLSLAFGLQSYRIHALKAQLKTADRIIRMQDDWLEAWSRAAIQTNKSGGNDVLDNQNKSAKGSAAVDVHP